MCYLDRVGIRELRQNLSVYLAKVKTGSVFAVTDRGKPVAVLKPLAADDDAWQRLVESGVVVPAAGSWSDIEPPKGDIDSSRSASKYLQELREADCERCLLRLLGIGEADRGGARIGSASPIPGDLFEGDGKRTGSCGSSEGDLSPRPGKGSFGAPADPQPRDRDCRSRRHRACGLARSCRIAELGCSSDCMRASDCSVRSGLHRL